MKYYVTKTDLGQYTTIKETEGKPVDMSKFVTVELPANNGTLTVISKGKAYPDYKVAQAIVAGQIKLEDVK